MIMAIELSTSALLKPLENNAVTATHSFLAEKEHWTRHYCSCCCCCPCGTVCLVKDAFCSIVELYGADTQIELW